MKDNFNALGAAKIVFAIIAARWANLPVAIHILLACMALDMFSGVLAAFVQKKVSSTTGLIGVSKKVMILVVILSTHLIEKSLGMELGLEKIAALGYTANELISITENAAHAGIWVPQQILDALAKLKGTNAAEPVKEPQV